MRGKKTDSDHPLSPPVRTTAIQTHAIGILTSYVLLCSWRAALPMFVVVQQFWRGNKQACSVPGSSCLLSQCNGEQPLWLRSFLKCCLFLPVPTVNASTYEIIRLVMCWFTDRLAWGERLGPMRDNTVAGEEINSFFHEGWQSIRSTRGIPHQGAHSALTVGSSCSSLSF